MITDLRYFAIGEFDCPCCHANMMDIGFLYRLDDARHISGVPFKINSGFRCLKHNYDIPGSSSTSSHLVGLAADVACTDDTDRYFILDALIDVGFMRLGLRKDFIHVDYDLTKKSEVFWVY